MTTALYRRYRPDTFQDVIGQDHVTAPLMAALRADRVTHAYLFSGPRGCGKTTSARILARCLNCEQAPTDAPCGECPSCRDLATGGPGSLDVVEIDAASHNGVDDARDLRERAAFAPARDRYKVFILDEAHMVTAQGFNALLKLVEEPPTHVKFIFATTEPDKVIGTIRSRTHHYPFRLVPPDVLEDYLGQLCDAEGVSVGPGVFPLVVRAGGGSVRDTLSVMDQLIGGAVDGSVDYQRAVALLGYTDTTLLDQCVDAVAAADGSGVFRVVERVVTSGHDPRRFVEDLLQRLRDLLVIALAGSQAGPALGSLPADQLARMEAQARTLGAAALSRAADTTSQALGSMVGATSPRLQLELLMARLLLPGAVPGAAAPSADGQAPAVGQPVRPLPTSTPGASAPTASPVPPAPTAPPSASEAEAAPQAVQGQGTQTSPGAVPGATEPLSASQPSPPRPGDGQGAPGAAEAEMIRTRWEEVLEAAKRSRRATWALVGPNSQPGSLREGALTLLFTAPGLVGAFENGGHGPVLSAAIHQALGLQVDVHAVLVGGDGPGGGGSRSGHWNSTQAGAGAAPVAWDRSQAGAAGPVASRDQGMPRAADQGAREDQEPPLPPEEPPVRLPEPPGQGRDPVAGADGVQEEPAPAGQGTRGEAYGGAAGAWTPGPGASVPDPDDGWGPVAVPGGGGAVHSAPELTGRTRQPVSGVPAGGASSPPPSSVSPPSPASSQESALQEPPLAPVRRLHALPDLPAAASPGPSGPGPSAASADVSDQVGERPSRPPLGLAPVTWDGPAQPAQTFSDGVPLPEEPGDQEEPAAEGALAERDGADDTWAPTGAAGSRLAAAMAAARAAAQEPDDHSALAEDTPSEDDEDAEDAGVVGLEVVKRVLGATVIEEVTVTQEGY
ncbi:DNA polymerase III subunit gamma/tau [Actinomyces lilanjuaniae]|uniref:DNA-directed DNA polymerase n=1 Tax=Actinomyces lilanjuaniae TaxID=2321394 RepID=A0ABN5PQY6_9ACTO|nr:DNA polymerase III subunit gamma and tau [Actinomyces lilanjuaniae]AYD88956.1 DNA polymerase III subunit gamma/tau [Actinomyces lilanjuaniae]